MTSVSFSISRARSWTLTRRTAFFRGLSVFAGSFVFRRLAFHWFARAGFGGLFGFLRASGFLRPSGFLGACGRGFQISHQLLQNGRLLHSGRLAAVLYGRATFLINGDFQELDGQVMIACRALLLRVLAIVMRSLMLCLEKTPLVVHLGLQLDLFCVGAMA